MGISVGPMEKNIKYLYLLQFPWDVLSDGRIMVDVLGVGPRQLQIDVRLGDRVSRHRHNNLK